ncbi:hypothetical protein EZS27_004962 [termite gut metagenome]|uniref:GmrSD restriction endonucleases N-terminal domain-containing protein n=1 Tax=termite gut metagenome TaxID=433724 RepID=A0A5J4SNS7_9ZZZZ
MEEIENNKEIEKEDRGDENITKPFDPSKIDVDIQVVNLGLLIDMLKEGEIDLNPDFQRSSDLWSPIQKSRLIESILLGLPLPSFYFSEDKETKKLSVIDGLQRLCTLKDFILKENFPLKLEGLQFLKQFDNKTYRELERPEIKRINSLKVVLNTLRKDTPANVKYVIFQRVNTAGIPLTPQEMRHALNQGRPAEFVKELAEMEEFLLATDRKISTKRMEDRDFVNRFLAFFLLGYDENYEGELDGFMQTAMSSLSEKDEKELQEIKTTFGKSMRTIYNIFDNDAFRKRYNKDDSRNVLSKSIFDTLSVNIAKLSDEEQKSLIQHKEAFINEMIKLFNNSEFNKAITTGTAKRNAVKCRFEEVKKIIYKTIRE